MMLPLTGAELSVVMLSLRAFKFYEKSVELFGQCQVSYPNQDSVLCHPLSCFDCPQTAHLVSTGLHTIKKGDRNRKIPTDPGI
jgi:hypothetical protein